MVLGDISVYIKEQTETYIPFWLQNLSGLTGRFALAQVPDIDSVFRDSMSRNNGKTDNQEKEEGDETKKSQDNISG